MNYILVLIDSIQESIFNYKINELKSIIGKLIIEIDKIMPNLNDDEIQILNNLLEYINIGMQNQDYLFVADVFHYDFRAFISLKIN